MSLAACFILFSSYESQGKGTFNARRVVSRAGSEIVSFEFGATAANGLFEVPITMDEQRYDPSDMKIVYV